MVEDEKLIFIVTVTRHLTELKGRRASFGSWFKGIRPSQCDMERHGSYNGLNCKLATVEN